MNELSKPTATASPTLRTISLRVGIVPTLGLTGELGFGVVMLVGLVYVGSYCALVKALEAMDKLDWEFRPNQLQRYALYSVLIALTGIIWAGLGVFRGEPGEYAARGLLLGLIMIVLINLAATGWRRLFG